MKLGWAGVLAVTALVLSASATMAQERAMAIPPVHQPIRDFVSALVPGLVPPRPCSRESFDLAHQTGVTPDVSGCTPTQVVGFISALLAMTPSMTQTYANAMATPIIRQDPLAGQAYSRGRRFTLILPAPPAVASPAIPILAPSGTDAASPTTVGDLNAAPTKQPPAGAGKLPTGATDSPSGTTSTATDKPPLPSLGAQLATWFWTDFNPLWVAGALLIAGLIVVRGLRPPRIVLQGAPTVRCDVTPSAGGHAVWLDNRHIVLNAPLFEVVVAPAPARAGPLTILDERVRRDV